ncbi:MAG TPA: M23 family metallopeptidase, partial [Nitrospirae bacterium]|nr:M23 family metallopeptidase [Nitrospirota bacterium]
HLGIDYAAPTGTPVSTAGNGTVVFAGYKGQNGNTVRIRHNGSYETYYGHLSRIPRKIRRGARVSQGDIIGYVGTTGLSTGPHLDYRMKHNGKFINPLKITLPRGTSIPVELIAGFKERVLALDARLTALTKPVIASSGKIKTSG